MTGYNKLKIAILAIMTSQSVNAITIDPIQIQSGSGDLLYAEMKFSNSNPNEKIEVGLASADDIQNVGVTTQAPGHLNFYTRRSNDGSGVIVITSSRPLIESELNILLKIKEGNATHLQQVKTPLSRNRNIPTPMLKAAANEKPLTPQIIVSEKDIALNLPTSTRYQSNQPPALSNTNTTTKTVTESVNSQQPLTISVVTTPPPLQSQGAVAKTTTQNTPTVTTTQTNANTVTSQAIPNHEHTNNTVPQTVVPTPQPVQKQSENIETKLVSIQSVEAKAIEPEPTTEKPTPKSTSAEPAKPTAKTETRKVQKAQNPKPNVANDKNAQHVVQANESLWKIASRIASETHQSIPEVMRQIKENNHGAFIQGDMNRIRRGAALNLAASYRQTPTTKYKVPAQAPVIAQKQSGAAKYRLDQAEMSIIADNEQSSAQGSAKKNTQMNHTSSELSTNVMTSREKTVKLQKNVTQLASGLQQKNQRIQLLNARLAQLEQQLQQQNVKKPNS